MHWGVAGSSRQSKYILLDLRPHVICSPVSSRAHRNLLIQELESEPRLPALTLPFLARSTQFTKRSRQREPGPRLTPSPSCSLLFSLNLHPLSAVLTPRVFPPADIYCRLCCPPSPTALPDLIHPLPLPRTATAAVVFPFYTHRAAVALSRLISAALSQPTKPTGSPPPRRSPHRFRR